MVHLQTSKHVFAVVSDTMTASPRAVSNSALLHNITQFTAAMCNTWVVNADITLTLSDVRWQTDKNLLTFLREAQVLVCLKKAAMLHASLNETQITADN